MGLYRIRNSRRFGLPAQPRLLHELHAEFLVGHLTAAELQLHPDLVATVKKLFAMADLRQVIVIVDVYPELDFLELGAGRFFVLILLGYVVAKLSESDNFTNWGVCGRCDFNHIESQSLSFAQGIRKLHDA